MDEMTPEQQKTWRDFRVQAASYSSVRQTFAVWFWMFVVYSCYWLAGFIGTFLGLSWPLSWLVYPVLACAYALLFYKLLKAGKPYREKEQKATYEKYSRIIAREDRMINGD